MVDRWLWSGLSSVQMRSTPCPFLLHFFLWSGRARLRCRFDDPLTWQGQRLNSYRSGWRRPLSSSLDSCWVWLSKWLKFFGLFATRILPVPTSGRPVALRIVTVNQAISGRSFFVHFPRFLKFLAPRWKKVQILQCGWAVRRMIAKSAVAILRRTSHCGETARFLPPFFWRYTTPPCFIGN